MIEVVPHRFTWAAIIVATFMVVPGLFVGGIVANIYKWFLTGYFSQDSWLGFFNFINKVVMLWFPSLLHGCIAGLVSLYITRNLFKAANLEIVSYAASAIWIACGIAFGAFGTATMGFQEDLVGLGAQVVGVTVGLFSFKFERG